MITKRELAGAILFYQNDGGFSITYHFRDSRWHCGECGAQDSIRAQILHNKSCHVGKHEVVAQYAANLLKKELYEGR